MKKKLISSIAAALMALTMLATGCSTNAPATSASASPATKASEAATTSEETPASEAAPASEATNTEAKILHLNNNSEPSTLNPSLSTGSHDSWILDHCFEGLMKKSVEGGYEPGIAESVDVSTDGKVYTFHLRDTKWSNGDPVVAQNFYDSWLFCLTPANASEYAYQLYYIKGSEEINTSSTQKDANGAPVLDADGAPVPLPEDEAAAMLADATAAWGVKVIDDKTLEVTLVNSTPYFLDLTTHYTYYPVNSALLASNPKWADDVANYVSNGAFVVKEWEHKSKVYIEKNPNYYNASAIKLDGIEFAIIEEETTAYQSYQAGSLDFVYPLPSDVIPMLQAEANPELQVNPDLSVYYYMFNTTQPGLNNVKVRRALAMAINRQAICTSVTQGGQQPAFGIVPAGLPDGKGDYKANQGPLFSENVEEAKALLAEGLKEEGLDPASWGFVILYNTSEAHKKIAEAVQDMWNKNLGIKVTLENQEFAVVLDRRTHLDYEVNRAGWIGDYVDPMTFIELFTTKSDLNQTGWSNAEYDSLVEQAMSEQDNEKRMNLMKDAEKILMEEMPIMPIYDYTKPCVLKPYVTGAFTPVNRYTQFIYADIQK